MEKGVADLEVLDLKGKGLIVYYDGKKHYVTVVEHSENVNLVGLPLIMHYGERVNAIQIACAGYIGELYETYMETIKYGGVLTGINNIVVETKSELSEFIKRNKLTGGMYYYATVADQYGESDQWYYFKGNGVRLDEEQLWNKVEYIIGLKPTMSKEELEKYLVSLPEEREVANGAMSRCFARILKGMKFIK